MAVTVLFFAQLRELCGVDRLSVVPTGAHRSAQAILESLPDIWRPLQALPKGELRCAINHTMQPLSALVQDGDEVAFFPPVTGG